MEDEVKGEAVVRDGVDWTVSAAWRRVERGTGRPGSPGSESAASEGCTRRWRRRVDARGVMAASVGGWDWSEWP